MNGTPPPRGSTRRPTPKRSSPTICSQPLPARRMTSRLDSALIGSGGIVVVLAVSPSAANRQVQSPLLGHPAPPVTGPSVTPHPFTSLNAFDRVGGAGQIFATWSVLCQR